MTITIPLAGAGNYVATIDDEDAELCAKYHWKPKRTKFGVYAVGRLIGAGSKTRQVDMHRLIMGEPDGQFIDHRDRDTMNNTRGNLRPVTPQESSLNRGRRGSVFAVPYKGVWLDARRRKRFAASVQLAGKKYHVGSFFTTEEAARAYDKKCLELHGEFAVTNVHLGLLAA